MPEKKAGGTLFPRLFAFLPSGPPRTFHFLLPAAAGAVLLVSGGYLFRPLWFDEALTLLNFAALPDPAAIYRACVIPNNQIVHTVLLHWLWTRLGVPGAELRLFPLACAILLLILLYRGFRRECGRWPLLTTLGALALSPPFLLYATALRGCMLAALLVTAAWLCGRKFAASGGFPAWLGWFGFALLALGVMPSALAGLAGAGLMILPRWGGKFWRKKRFYALAAAIPAAFALFYGPILPQLQASFALKEGWHDSGAALLALAVAVAATFNVLFVAAAAMLRRRSGFRTFCAGAVWLLPLGTWCFPVAPFPRVWFVLFPVWAVLLARGVRRCRSLRLWWFVPLLIAASLQGEAAKAKLSPLCSRAGQDDFFAPYFLRREFDPGAAARLLTALRPPLIWSTLSADPWSLRAAGVDAHCDGPWGRLVRLPENAAVVLRRDEDPTTVERRFGGRLTRIAALGYQTVYQWREK